LNTQRKIKLFVGFLVIFLGVSGVYAEAPDKVEIEAVAEKPSAAKDIVLNFQK